MQNSPTIKYTRNEEPEEEMSLAELEALVSELRLAHAIEFLKGKPDAQTDPVNLRIATALVLREAGAPILALKGKIPVEKGWTSIRIEQQTDDEVVAIAERGNIGMPTGKASGCVVFDFDSTEVDRIKRELGIEHVVTQEVVTGRGGRQLRFVAPAVPLKNTVKVLHPEVDTRGEGGQVVLPGSIHPDTGRAYEWTPGRSPADVELAPLPDGLLKLWVKAQIKKAPGIAPVTDADAVAKVEALDPAMRERATAYAGKALSNIADELSRTEEGKRNDKLFEKACRCFELANSSLLDHDEVEATLTEAAKTAGLGDEEIADTLRSASTRVSGKGVDLGKQLAERDAAAEKIIGSYKRKKLDKRPDDVVDSAEPAPVPESRLRSISSDILNLKAPPAIVKGLIYEGDLVMPYGAPGSGKTFAVLDLALAVAAGMPNWAGRKVTSGPVVYVAGEGKRGLYNRIRAWAKKRGDERGQLDRLNGRLFVFEGAPQFLDAADWAAFLADLEAVEAPRLVVFDTLSRCIAGKDENSQADMSAAVDRLRDLCLRTRAAVLLVHHTSKDGQHERGSSVLRGAADVMFRVSKDTDAVTLEFDKIKEGELPDDALRFRFEGCQLGVDEDGDAIWSATVRFEPPRKDGIGSTERKLLKALDDMVGDGATARDWAKAAGYSNRGGRFNERVRALLGAGLVSEDPTRGTAPRFAVTRAGKELLGLK